LNSDLKNKKKQVYFEPFARRTQQQKF
jgi:hypothetical protein